MSLWRKRNVQHNGQNQPKWFNMTALANNDLSIKSEDLSIKSGKGTGMTLQEIEELAGHRKVSPWVVKLVGDAVAKEREACLEIIDNFVDYPYLEPTMKAIRARGQA